MFLFCSYCQSPQTERVTECMFLIGSNSYGTLGAPLSRNGTPTRLRLPTFLGNFCIRPRWVF